MTQRVRIMAGSVFGIPGAFGLEIIDSQVAAYLPKGSHADIDYGSEAMISPAFFDAHLHLTQYGTSLQRVNLYGVRSFDEVKARIATAAAARPEGSWVLGRGYHEEHVGRTPTAVDLGALVGNRLAAIATQDGHSLWVSPSVIALCDLDARPDPVGGRIERGPDGKPTGMLRETAQEYVTRHIPEPDQSARREAQKNAIADLLSRGIVGAGSYESTADLPTLAGIADEGLPFHLSVYRYAEQLQGEPPQMLGKGMPARGAKFFLDGTLGSRTAWLTEPYCDVAGTGLGRHDDEELIAAARPLVAQGFQISMHCIGDAATAQAIRVIEAVGAPGARIEHLQLVRPEDVAAMGRLGVYASVQPSHLLTDLKETRKAWGERRSRLYPYGTFFRQGRLAIGSDAPVESPDPALSLLGAVLRARADQEPLVPEEAISLAAAVQGYTRGAAASMGFGGYGTLTVGAAADVAVLATPYKPGQSWPLCLATFVGGVLVSRHDAPWA